MTTATPGPRHLTVTPGVPTAVRWALGFGVAAGVTAAGISLFADRAAFAGALIGAGLVVTFFGFGALTVNAVASRLPAAALLVAVLTYTLEVLLLGMVFWSLTSGGVTDDAVDADWLGGTVIAGTLAWVIGQLIGTVRTRQLLYDLEPDDDRPHGQPGGGDHQA